MARLEALEQALDAMVEPLVVTGACRPTGPIALELPGGPTLPVASTADAEALLPHTEQAPFGDGRITRADPAVRRTLRLTARGDVRVHGFDPAALVDEIERAISPRVRLAATLLDVHIYPPGGHFTAHIDTPRAEDMIGTLVVALPSKHAGGALFVRDDGSVQRYPWGAATDGTLEWAAFYGDVEHAVEPVESGYRVTLTYALAETGEARPAPDPARMAGVRAELVRVVTDRKAKGHTLMMPCARRVIVPRGAAATVAPHQLRGADREVAELARELGIELSIRPCLAFLDDTHRQKPTVAYAAPMVFGLDQRLSAKDVDGLRDMITVADKAHDDDGALKVATLARRAKPGGAKLAVTTIGDRTRAPAKAVWLWRRRARATYLHEATFSASGYFGNEHFDALIYELVALELRLGAPPRGLAAPPARVASRPARPAPPRPQVVRHAKHGKGYVLSVEGEGVRRIAKVQFDLAGVQIVPFRTLVTITDDD